MAFRDREMLAHLLESDGRRGCQLLGSQTYLTQLRGDRHRKRQKPFHAEPRQTRQCLDAWRGLVIEKMHKRALPVLDAWLRYERLSGSCPAPFRQSFQTEFTRFRNT